ncbi:HTH domain-containing protein [Clostridium tertium]|uniref:Putative licABCH operon regulator n=1 Tax=Clostridium tertium TaxID=1559 RepID=A0A6N3E631_9CLOT
MAVDRKKLIINTLYENDGNFVTSQELAELLGTSTRTIKRYLKELLSDNDDFGYRIVSSNKGYILTVINEDIFNNKVIGKELGICSNREQSSRPDIIAIFLVLNENITMDELSERLYISKSTISKEILYSKKILKKYNLKLKNKPYYGYFVEGSERDKRKLIYAYLENIINNKRLFQEYFYMRLEEFESVKEKVISILMNNNIYKSDNYIEYITKVVFVNMERIKSNNLIILENQEIFTLDKNTITAVKEIFSYFNMDSPMEEYIYLSSLLGNSYYNNSLYLSGERLEVNNESIIDLMFICIEKIKDVMKIDYTDDLHLINGLASHIHSSLGRYSMGVELDNPILEMIKSKYIESYNCALICRDILLQKMKVSLSEDDIGFIALHFAAANERNFGYLIKICVICENGIGFSQLVKSKLEEKLSGVEIVHTVPSYMLSAINEDKYDLLVSTTNLTNTLFKKPLVKIRHDLIEDDINKIKDIVNKIKVRKYYFNKIPKDLFFNKVRFNNKEELLDCVFRHMLEKGYITDNQIVDIMRREELSETIINNNVGLPHCIKNGESIGAIVTLEKPIKWGNGEVRVVIISCINPKIGIERILFPLINRNTASEEKINKLIEANSLEEFVNVISQ